MNIQNEESHKKGNNPYSEVESDTPTMSKSTLYYSNMCPSAFDNSASFKSMVVVVVWGRGVIMGHPAYKSKPNIRVCTLYNGTITLSAQNIIFQYCNKRCIITLSAAKQSRLWAWKWKAPFGICISQRITEKYNQLFVYAQQLKRI